MTAENPEAKPLAKLRGMLKWRSNATADSRPIEQRWRHFNATQAELAILDKRANS